MLQKTTLFFSFLLVNIGYAQIVGVNGIVNPYNYTITKNQMVTKAGVVSAHPLASAVGSAILKNGGNAYDAAVATQLVLAVVYPNAGNIGGGGFLVGYNPTTKISHTVDYREKAPAAATKDMYLDAAGNANTNLSQFGHKACGVPGTVAGLVATHKFGKLPWANVVQPAIDIAEKGFVISQREAEGLNGQRDDFTTYNTKPTAFVKEKIWKKGDTLLQPELATTLTRIRDKGQAGFYEGETANLIVAEMQRGNGIITLQDLKNYTAATRTPIQYNYKRKFTIVFMPPPSSGGVLVQMMLNMLEKYDLKKLQFQSANYIQLLTEVERLAYADRAMHLGDMDFYKVPLKTLTSKKYAAERMVNYKPNIAGKSDVVKAGVIPYESEETTHLSIIDENGIMISVTTTLNGSYGSKTIVGGAGFLLNNEMDDFSVKPGVANMYGALGGEANKIEPGKRMLSSMTPTIVLKNGRPFIVCGTPGGTTIITSVLQTILNICEFDMTAKDAVNKPKFHHQWYPDEIFVEKSLNTTIIEELTKMGYRITPRAAIGRTEVIKILPNKQIELAADFRGDDAAAGY